MKGTRLSQIASGTINRNATTKRNIAADDALPAVEHLPDQADNKQRYAPGSGDGKIADHSERA